MLVQYTGKNLYTFCDKFRLFPGINEVDDSLINEAMDHPIFKKRVAAGAIVIIKARQSDGKMSLQEMKTFVPQIYDKKLLEKILSEDERIGVQELVVKQLEKIKHPGLNTKKDKSDEVEYFGGSIKGE